MHCNGVHMSSWAFHSITNISTIRQGFPASVMCEQNCHRHSWRSSMQSQSGMETSQLRHCVHT